MLSCFNLYLSYCPVIIILICCQHPPEDKCHQIHQRTPQHLGQARPQPGTLELRSLLLTSKAGQFSTLSLSLFFFFCLLTPAIFFDSGDGIYSLDTLVESTVGSLSHRNHAFFFVTMILLYSTTWHLIPSLHGK